MRPLNRILATLTLGAACGASALAQKHPAGEIQLDIQPDTITIESRAEVRRGKVEILVLARFVPGPQQARRGSVAPRQLPGGAVPGKIRLTDGTLHLFRRVTLDGKVVHTSGDQALYKTLIERARKLLGPDRLTSLRGWADLRRRAAGGRKGRLGRLWPDRRPGGSRAPQARQRPRLQLGEVGLCLSHSQSARANQRMQAELTQLIFVIDGGERGRGGASSSGGGGAEAGRDRLTDTCKITVRRGRE